MPLTPQDIANKLFGKEFRGYAMEQVDAFLEEVERELARVLTENASLASRAAAPTPADAPTPIAAGESQEAALRTLLMAQRTADQAIAEARGEADQLLTDARALSAEIEGEAKARTAAALAELEGKQGQLEVRIEDLRAFEREYRLRLKAYLESQLKDLDVRGGDAAEGTGAGVPAAARTAAVGVITPGVTNSAAARPAPTAPPAPSAAGAAPAPASAVAVEPAGTSEVVAPEPGKVTAPDGAPGLPEGELPQLGPNPGPDGPPREALLPPMPHSPRAVPALTTVPEPIGPFTVVPAPVQREQVDEGSRPPTQP